jgi:hypothetical protein
VTLGIIGCDNISQLEKNVEFARSFSPMDEDERNFLVELIAPYSRRLMYYKP